MRSRLVWAAALAVCLVCIPALAQHRGFSGGGFRVGVGGGHWGSRGFSSSSFGYGGFRSYNYGYRRSLGVGFGYGPSWYRYPAGRFPYLIRSYRPYAYYPYFYTSFGVSPYYYDNWYLAPPPVTAYYYNAPRAYVYSGSARDEYGQLRDKRSGETIVYSIAFQDGHVEDCVAYWVEGETLHYVTRDHAMHEVPLGSVDRSYSERLNRERQVDFRLPGR